LGTQAGADDQRSKIHLPFHRVTSPITGNYRTNAHFSVWRAEVAQIQAGCRMVGLVVGSRRIAVRPRRPGGSTAVLRACRFSGHTGECGEACSSHGSMRQNQSSQSLTRSIRSSCRRAHDRTIVSSQSRFERRKKTSPNQPRQLPYRRPCANRLNLRK
jgi:hypothetical protein